MTNILNMRKGLVPVVIVVGAMLTPVTIASAQDNGVRQEGQGKYAQLTAQWWQWILEQPATGNPILDTTGADAANGQPLADVNVFFLAGTFGETLNRAFSVQANTALFLPLLNNVGLATKPAPQPKTGENQVPQLRALAAPFVDNATDLHVTLDGVSLLGSVGRIKSPTFHVMSPEDGFLGAGTFTAVSDGYWLFLPPLTAGVHLLNFGGTSGGTTVNVTDTITVLP